MSYYYVSQPQTITSVNRNTPFGNISFLWTGSFPYTDFTNNYSTGISGANAALTRRPAPTASNRGRYIDATASGTIEYNLFAPTTGVGNTTTNRARYSSTSGISVGVIFRRNSSAFNTNNGFNMTTPNFWSHRLQFTSNGNITVASSNIGTITSDSTYSVGQWVAAVATFRLGSAGAKLYVNGVQQSQTLTPTVLADTGIDRASFATSGIDVLAAFASKDIVGLEAAKLWYENPWILFGQNQIRHRLLRDWNYVEQLPVTDTSKFLMFFG